MQKDPIDYKIIAEEMDKQIRHVVRTEKQLYDTRDKLDKEVTGLKKMQNLTTEMLVAGAHPDHVGSHVINHLLNELEFEKAVLFLYKDDNFELISYGGYSEIEIEKLKEKNVVRHDVFLDIANSKQVKLYDFSGNIGISGKKEKNSEFLILDYFLATSLRGRKDRPIGLLLAGFSKERREYILPEITEEDISLFTGLSSQAALFLENSKINERLDHAVSELKVERDKVSTIINNLNDGIIMTDAEGKIVFLNPEVSEILLFDRKSAFGKRLAAEDARNNADLKNLFDILNLELKQGEKKEFIMEEPEKKVLLITSANVTGKDGLFFGDIRVMHDITREKEIDEMKSQFITIAAHQLRTPLSAIKWILKLLIDGDAGETTPDQKELLIKGFKSNERIIALVNDMLNVSRIEEGRFGYKICKADIRESIKLAREYADTLIKEKQIKFNIDIPPKLPDVRIDVQKMSLAIQNFLDNAIKYTPERGNIDMQLKVIDNTLQLSIKDNGVGIPDKDQEKIFTKFFRAENALRLQTEGSGLGLYIAKNIIKKHKGHLFLKSKEGLGTEFIFTLPLKA
jgi:PAS domain S-box-containing protein